MLQDRSLFKELSTKSKRESEICVSQCPISQMETTINNLNRGNLTQSISNKGVGIAGGTKAEGKATYSVVPAGSTREAVLPRAHPHQLLLLLSLLPPLLPLLPPKSFSHLPLPIAHHFLSLADPNRKKDKK